MGVLLGLPRLLPLFLLVASGGASVLHRSSDINTVNLFSRQNDLPEDSALCIPSSWGHVAKAVLARLAARSRNEVQRLFTYNPGSTDYSGKSSPKQAQVDAYIPAVDNGAEDGYFHPPLMTIELRPSGNPLDERAVSQQRSFGTDPFQIISTNVYGCTVIVVASTRGVWMTHLWESYSNGKNEKGEHLDTLGDPAFNERVLKFLKGEQVSNPSPNGWRDYVAPTGPGIDATLFNIKTTDQTSVYVFTPCKFGINKASEACLKFPNRYGRGGEVLNTIAEIFGVRKPRLVLTPYVPLNTLIPADDARLGTDSRGAVLFQYDPNSDGKGKKAWRLFMEARMTYMEVK